MTLDLTINEVNLILQALGNLPYVQVFEIIQKIREQAEGQLQAPPENSPSGSE